MEEKQKRRKRRSKRILDRLNPAYESFAGYPVLTALAVRPLKSSEVSKMLLMSRSAVRKRLLALELSGHVVQRKIDGRWVLRHRLVAETTPLVGESYNALQAAQKPVSDLGGLKINVPADVPDSEAPEGAKKLAALFGVPVQVKKLGWVRFGVEAKCVGCSNTSKLKYGSTVICVECANSWRTNVQD